MSAPVSLDEFDRFLAIESPVEKYVCLGLAFEEILEKLRHKGSEAEREAFERVLELPQARAHLIELGAERLLDAHAAKLEEAFAENPRKWGEPLNRVFKQNRDDLARLVTTTMTDLLAAKEKRVRRGSAWARPAMAAAGVAIVIGLVAFVLYRVGIFDPAMMKLAAR
jgi:NAD-specific glutamate dehydrogenase